MQILKKELIRRDDGKLYLVRWIIIRCRLFGIFLHKFVSSDDDCLHDHPWSFITILLKGGYGEYSIRENNDFFGWIASKKHMVYNEYRPGSILFRPAHYTHRVVIFGKPAWSLVFTGRKRRPWGFWTKRGWVSHHEYFASGGCE